MVTAIDRILQGAVDLHTHSGPSPMPRRINHVEAAQLAAEAGFRAIAVKCHYHSTVTDLLAMTPRLAGIPIEVFGGVALNSTIGGLNPYQVDLTLKLGGKIIWFPTISARAHLDNAAHNENTRSHFQPLGMQPQAEVSVFGEDGSVRPEVYTILEMAREAGALVSTGHLDPDSAGAVVDAAAEVGHKQVLFSHPNYVTGIGKEKALSMVRAGAYVEHCVVMYDNEKIFPLSVLLDWIETIGPEHTILGSDLGQVGNQLPVEGYRSLIPKLLDSGVPERDVKQMIAANPAHLIGLDA